MKIIWQDRCFNDLKLYGDSLVKIWDEKEVCNPEFVRPNRFG